MNGLNRMCLLKHCKHTILVPNMHYDSGVTTEAHHVIDLCVIYMYMPTIVPNVVAP